MSKSLESILGYVPLMEAIETILKGIPDPLPKAFSTTTREVTGNTARYITYNGTRQTAHLAQYGSPAVKRQLRDISSQDVVLMHAFESISFDPVILQQLRNYSDYNVQRMGEEEVARQVGNFTEVFHNLRKASMMMMLVNGALYFDANGNLLPSSTGAVETVSSLRSPNNSGQLNGMVTLPWNLQSANIPLDLRNIKQRSIQDTGFEPKYALYGVNIPGYMEQNDNVEGFLSRNQTWSDKALSSTDLPDGLFGFTWVPMYKAFFDDQNGTHQNIWDADTVVFCPEPDKRWWEVIEGSYPVPTSINVQNNAEAALDSLKITFGRFAYSQVSLNPVSVQTYMGDTFFPAIKNPAVTYALKTKF